MLRKLKKGIALLLVLSFVFGSTSFASAEVLSGETSGEKLEYVEEPGKMQEPDEERKEDVTEENTTEEQEDLFLQETEEKEEVTEEGESLPEVGKEQEPIAELYYEWQTEEEILALCEEGLDLEEFFRYTIWGFVTEEQLRALVENGHTLDDVYAVIENMGNGTNLDTLSPDIRDVIEAYASMPMLMSLGDTRTAGFSGSMSSALGNIPALGSGSHGPILKIHLSGETAFCAKFGAACRTGMVYTSVPMSEIGVDSGKEQIIKGLLAQYAQAQEIYTGPVNYIMAQAGIWLVQNGAWTGDADGMAASIAPLFTKTPDCPSVEFAASYFRAIVEWIADPANASRIAGTHLEAWAFGPNQYLITATGDGTSDPVGYAHVEIEKTDSETGNVIAYDAAFTIYEWNGSAYVESESKINREGSRYVSEDLLCSLRNEGKFQIEESYAPHNGNISGYYGDYHGGSKNRYEILVTEDMQGETIRIGNAGEKFENERTTGSITVKKTDIEADAYLKGDSSHGISTLDGAIYDLYAGEDILHPDGVKGVLYRKDTLVSSGTIVNGTCTFTELYLGTYYVKERQKGETLADGKKLSYAKGYLLDEMIYHVTLPYEGERVRNVHRQVDSNKEQVIKAKAVIEKVESATGQGNINYLKGAGFTVYRIDKLSRRDSFTRNADGSYKEASIQKAYLVEGYDQDTPKYDFRGEDAAIATLYIRNTDMRMDTAHYWEDGKADLDAGKLIPIGNHYYRVAELFSDANGQMVTPYLPYGQYLVVETTVPEDHFMAPPFVLTFNEGRTTKVITTGVTENTPYGINLLKSSGDVAASYEAVYFSQIVDNEAIEELLKIYKKDTDTGKTVLLADTKFKIAKINEETGAKTYLTHTSYYPDTVNRDVFCTNGEGTLQLPELLAAGVYQIEEVDGPNGFYNDVPGGYVKFRVTTDRNYESLLGSGEEGSMIEGDFGNRDVILIIEDYYNRETRGELTLRKQGEVLTGYKETTLLGRIRSFFGMESEKQFIYEELPLSGVEYTIRAAEDIVTQDRQMDENGNRTLWFQKGEVIAVITTGEDGQVDETKVSTTAYPDGHPVVRVKHEGTLGSVKIYLPLGSYEIAETKAPYGYTRTEETYTVTFTWEHQFEETVFHTGMVEDKEDYTYEDETGMLTVTNARVKAVPDDQTTVPGIGIYKRDREKDIPLKGVTFGLYTKDAIYTRTGEKLVDAGELLSTVTTGADGRGVFDVDLPIREEGYGEEEGKNSGSYEIRELETPSGILMDDTPIPVEFCYIDDQTEFVMIAKEQKNASSEVFISKQDLTNGEELKGAKLSVMERFSGEVAAEWISDGKRKEIRGLAVNESPEDNTYTYLLREETAPNGYLVAESIVFKLVKEESEEDIITNSVYLFDEILGEWKKLDDKTVVMKDAKGTPDTPDGPDTPDQPKTLKKTPDTPKTGDGARTECFLLLLLLSIGGITMLIFRKRRKGA